MISDKYKSRCALYLLWANAKFPAHGLGKIPAPELSSDGPSAEKYMQDWESYGVAGELCSNPQGFLRLARGKQVRDFWTNECRSGLRIGMLEVEYLQGVPHQDCYIDIMCLPLRTHLVRWAYDNFYTQADFETDCGLFYEFRLEREQDGLRIV